MSILWKGFVWKEEGNKRLQRNFIREKKKSLALPSITARTCIPFRFLSLFALFENQLC